MSVGERGRVGDRADLPCGAPPRYSLNTSSHRPRTAEYPRCGRIDAVSSNLDPEVARRLGRNEAGLVPAVVQEHGTGQVLMLAWMDDEALHRTLTTGRATYWSRSRNRYWVKGETSGHAQHVKSVALDCDGDTLLITVEQTGAACHTGNHTCFFTPLEVAG
ncbi:phosphoribosyl-AMP cyclohydrolase [Dactylosporangium sp. NPDC051485]|uniref:phosphoribosyl-AMP cyclohydrolase n=1 Tax=Dactylosporangium sp. NPDC051485 TaxID=3154846 RepID=UPI00343A7118